MSCRPLTPSEYELVKSQFSNPRDKLLFILAYRTGYRISETLSLKIKDVLNPTIRVVRSNMKGKTKSREVVIHPELKQAITDYLYTIDSSDTNLPLFKSRQGDNKPLTRHMAHYLFKQAYKKAGLTGNGLSTHCTRKSWAKSIYKKSGNNLVLTQKALGHSDITTTVKYLNVFQDEIDALVLE